MNGLYFHLFSIRVTGLRIHWTGRRHGANDLGHRNQGASLEKPVPT